MAELTFEQVLTAARSLGPEQKRALVSALQAETRENFLREQLLAELIALRQARAFEQVDSLRNQYHATALEHVSDEELLSAIHESAAEWEADLGELTADDH